MAASWLSQRPLAPATPGTITLSGGAWRLQRGPQVAAMGEVHLCSRLRRLRLDRGHCSRHDANLLLQCWRDRRPELRPEPASHLRQLLLRRLLVSHRVRNARPRHCRAYMAQLRGHQLEGGHLPQRREVGKHRWRLHAWQFRGLRRSCMPADQMRSPFLSARTILPEAASRRPTLRRVRTAVRPVPIIRLIMRRSVGIGSPRFAVATLASGLKSRLPTQALSRSKIRWLPRHFHYPISATPMFRWKWSPSITRQSPSMGLLRGSFGTVSLDQPIKLGASERQVVKLSSATHAQLKINRPRALVAGRIRRGAPL